LAKPALEIGLFRLFIGLLRLNLAIDRFYLTSILD